MAEVNLNALIGIFVFILGAAVGSFLNVCIWRLPRSESIVFPPSHCPNCNRVIAWYDNVPFLSFALLGGKCRFCRKPISPRYLLVEAITAAAFLGLYLYFPGDPRRVFIAAILVSCLIAVAVIDLKHFIIPDEINFFGLGAALAASLFYPPLHGIVLAGGWSPAAAGRSFLLALLGAGAGAGLIYLTGVLGKMAFRKEAMGGGDVKLMAMMGAFLGWKLAILTFFLAPFFGTPVGIYLKWKYKTEIIPYGPFLALAGVVSLLAGERILRALFGFS